MPAACMRCMGEQRAAAAAWNTRDIAYAVAFASAANQAKAVGDNPKNAVYTWYNFEEGLIGLQPDFAK